MSRRVLTVRGFGPIRRAEVGFSDLTVLVGPQGTGKSLLLQWLKLVVDRNRIASTLSKFGYEFGGDPSRLFGLYFGSSYRDAWRSDSRVTFDGRPQEPSQLARSKRTTSPDRVLVVPAHRALVLSAGWPTYFRGLGLDTPFVVRDFSERTRDYLDRTEAGAVFPVKGRYRNELRRVLDESLFHGGRVEIETRASGEKFLQLVHDGGRFSVMEWTTGQREALPLIVGLYDALPSGKQTQRPGLDWVIVEEPELGLHPDAIVAVIVLLLDLRRRGYRVVLSTHSPLVLDIVWVIGELARRPRKRAVQALLRILGLPSTAFSRELVEAALDSQTSVVHTRFVDGAVESKDITSLDPSEEDEDIAGWGGLTSHSSRISELLASVTP